MKIAKCVKYKIDEETYTLFPLSNSCLKRYVLVDDISYQVYCLLYDGYSLEETIAEMLKRYDVDKEVFWADLQMILNQWEEYGIVEGCQITMTTDASDEEVGGEYEEMTDMEIYDMMYQAAIQKKAPFKVYFEITHNCNLRCRHCYIQETVRMQGNVFLDNEVILRTLDELEAMGTHEIVITGGECTLHKDFLEIINHICKLGMKLILLTNGNLINREFIEKVMDYPIADIRISIYGKESTHDEMTCVEGSYQKSVNALKMLRQEKGIGLSLIHI